VEIAKQKGIPTIELSNPREDMAKLAAEVYGHPEMKANANWSYRN